MTFRNLLIWALLPACFGFGSCEEEEPSACTKAKIHLCEKIEGMNCSALFMDTARERIEKECGAEERQAYVEYAEAACSAKTLKCDGEVHDSGATGAGGAGSCTASPEYRYSGKTEFDGQSATLTLKLTGTQVTGVLTKQPVCGDSIRLNRVEASFTGTLAGTWESDGASVSASWSGGDYGCDGNLVADYPTSGSLVITVSATEVRVKRASEYEYVFPRQFVTYSPEGC
jgi:hypothetical protein